MSVCFHKVIDFLVHTSGDNKTWLVFFQGFVHLTQRKNVNTNIIELRTFYSISCFIISVVYQRFSNPKISIFHLFLNTKSAKFYE
jgi:hypothetical protein